MKRIKQSFKVLAVLLVLLLAFQSVAFGATVGYVLQSKDGSNRQFDLDTLVESYNAYLEAVAAEDPTPGTAPGAGYYATFLALLADEATPQSYIDDELGYVTADTIYELYEALKEVHGDDKASAAMDLASYMRDLKTALDNPENTLVTNETVKKLANVTIKVVGADGQDSPDEIKIDADGIVTKVELAELNITVPAPEIGKTAATTITGVTGARITAAWTDSAKENAAITTFAAGQNPKATLTITAAPGFEFKAKPQVTLDGAAVEEAAVGYNAETGVVTVSKEYATLVADTDLGAVTAAYDAGTKKLVISSAAIKATGQTADLGKIKLGTVAVLGDAQFADGSVTITLTNAAAIEAVTGFPTEDGAWVGALVLDRGAIVDAATGSLSKAVASTNVTVALPKGPSITAVRGKYADGEQLQVTVTIDGDTFDTAASVNTLSSWEVKTTNGTIENFTETTGLSVYSISEVTETSALFTFSGEAKGDFDISILPRKAILEDGTQDAICTQPLEWLHTRYFYTKEVQADASKSTVTLYYGQVGDTVQLLPGAPGAANLITITNYMGTWEDTYYSIIPAKSATLEKAAFDIDNFAPYNATGANTTITADTAKLVENMYLAAKTLIPGYTTDGWEIEKFIPLTLITAQ